MNITKKDQERESFKIKYDFDKVATEIENIHKRTYLKKRYVVQQQAIKAAQRKKKEQEEAWKAVIKPKKAQGVEAPAKSAEAKAPEAATEENKNPNDEKSAVAGKKPESKAPIKGK